ncbi:hypothetical protein HA402_005033 [Bradysia odoriphaga]|nr:hypothetical protein HA402_005033 [Bradysia odoriphaga]
MGPLTLMSIFQIIGWLLAIGVAYFLYACVYKNWSYFSDHNITYDRGIPLLGSMWDSLTGTRSFVDSAKRIYDKYPNEKFFGMYDNFGQPGYVIRDPELIKQIAIKDFDSFRNHSFSIPEHCDSLFGRSLFSMNDQRWKDMRTTLSPVFTGSKMRIMFSLIGEVSQRFCSFLKYELVDGSLECDVKDLFSRFSNDAIASAAFGMEINSLKDRSNHFFKTGESLSSMFDGFSSIVKIVTMIAAPKLANILGMKLINEKDAQYCRDIVKSNMEHREKNNIVRNDVIQLLMDVRKGLLTENTDDVEESGDIGFATVKDQTEQLGNKIQKWEEDDLVAQCMLFFVGGFATVSLTISFIAHALAVYPEVQEQLLDEIKRTEEKLDGNALNYDALQQMKYLDMIVSETMRMWSQGGISERKANKPFELQDDKGSKITVEVGQAVLFPMHGLHMDPKWFPEPDKFDPERFSDENKSNIVSGTYAPFGLGPRACIASRFALMECKACIYHLVKSYRLEPSSKTQHPIKLKAGVGNTEAEKGFWLRISLRQ